MISYPQNLLSSNDRQFLRQFIGFIQKCGNRERSLSCFCSLITKLKIGIAGSAINYRYPLKTLGVKNPIKLLSNGLYNLKPAFFIRRHIKSGRLYSIPVPISEKHANFLAINWIRKTILKNNKNNLSFSSLLAHEISALLYHQGSSLAFSKAYIDIALDQRPFSKFIRRRRFTVIKSKRTSIAKRLLKVQHRIRRSMKMRKYRLIAQIRKSNIRDIRKKLVKNKKLVKRRISIKRNKIRKKIRIRAIHRNIKKVTRLYENHGLANELKKKKYKISKREKQPRASKKVYIKSKESKGKKGLNSNEIGVKNRYKKKQKFHKGLK